MPLTPGTRFGAFEIVGPIGAGGMGEVYRARDTRLDRDVALKVLPDLFTSDPDRLARFEREAKVLASLNHPNIAQVYGFEASAIAMELVDGQTLADLIAISSLPLTQTLAIARQIATALEAAHDLGIVHRDLKPANIKVREDGTVKVLDFGLAKAMTSDDPSAISGVANSPTLTARATQMGMILGTAAYMAPEQAKGRAVDRRADVWAFGAVVFEMVAGSRAFDGDDVSEVLASVLKTDPNWAALPADTPAPLLRLLKRCLERDPKRRLRDIGEGILQLDEGLAAGESAIRSGPLSPDTTDAGARTASRPLWQRAWPVLAAVVVTALATTAVMRWMRAAPPIAAPMRFTVDVAPAPLFVTSSRRDLAIAPDGSSIVYSGLDSGRAALYLRRLDQLQATVLTGGQGAIAPEFSADGRWIAYVDQADQSVLKRIPVTGGPALTICNVATTPSGIAWLPDGTIVMGVVGFGLHQVPEGGGTPTPLTSLDPATKQLEHLWPSAVPNSDLILFVVSPGGMPISTGQLAVYNRATKQVVKLGITGSHPKYLPSGHIAYAVQDGSIRAVRFDARTLSTSGSPAPVLDGVGVKTSGAANFDVSADGRLVYSSSGGGTGVRTAVWTDRKGRETAIATPPRSYFYVRISPDGKWLSLDARDQEEDIWIWDLSRETISRLTDKPGPDQYGLWAPDQRLVFSSTMAGRQELFLQRPDGVGQPVQITDTSAENLVPFPNAISPDGRQVIFRAASGPSKNDLFVVEVGGDRKVRKLLATEHDERNASFSPDGKFIVFESDMSGEDEVYVRPFPDVDAGQSKVSTAGGTEAVWARSGEIFYLGRDGQMMAVPVRTTAGVELGRPFALFDTKPYYFAGLGRNYDVTPDGKRFAMVKNPESTGAAVPLTVVLHWAAEVGARVK